MHLLIAPNAFKNSLTAREAAKAISDGLIQDQPDILGHPDVPGQSDILGQPRIPLGRTLTTECFPIGDGGDGTGDELIDRLGGCKVAASARDPLGRPIITYFGWIADSSTAVIEMANASGLRLLDSSELNPARTTSHGTGDLIRAALGQGAKHIILGMGGSATVDGGTGMLEALGVRFYSDKGQRLTDLPSGLIGLASIDMTGLDPRLVGVELTVLCDVTNPLTGPQGAAAVFGPQKGASQKDVQSLDTALTRLAVVIEAATGVALSTLPRTGTAGGAAAGLHGLLHAQLVSGIDYFLEITGFDQALDRCDWVITGEGSIDEQTLQGKAPHGVATRAKKKGRPVFALAGKVPLQEIPELKEYFDILLPISHAPVDLATALRNTACDLTRTAAQLGNLLTPLCKVTNG